MAVAVEAAVEAATAAAVAVAAVAHEVRTVLMAFIIVPLGSNS